MQSINLANNTWRPSQTIRVKVIGLAKKENQLLVCEVLDDCGKLKGWCPLGGGVEFGETAEQALKRELWEELSCPISIIGAPFVCENVFEHHGMIGHEIIFAFPILLSNPDIYTKKRFQIQEDRGSLHWVEWIDMQSFQTGKATLFPSALLQLIHE